LVGAFGAVGIGAATMLAANTKAASKLDSTRFMQTPLARIDQMGPHKTVHNFMKLKGKMAIAMSSPRKKVVAFLPHLC
jgi:hypothetical protein